ncbi:MAG: hypothetical protein JEZ03_15375 [Bacteroidales bacterium]|nr:hypothetical protein [Bacteroidales bacterium]
MKHLKTLILAALIISNSFVVMAQKHDTIRIQTFSFDDPSPEGWCSPYKGTFTLPDNDKSWEKILMIRTLKCDTLTKADKLPCGEWDYLTHTIIKVPTVDSTEEFALGSFITPYGIRLNMGGEKGWTWVYDVTDYAPVLKGELEFISGNNQELLDMEFLFIEGTPVREALSVENIYPFGNYKYEALALDSVLKEKTIVLNPQAQEFRLRARISGHGHHGPLNCCEWDGKTHTYVINEWERFRWNVWKDCGFNPIYPQGGTWPFDRAGWCPGTKVDEYDFELTPKVHSGDSINIDYSIEMFTDNGEKNGDFWMSHQLFSYKEANFENDVTLEEIIAPSSEDRHSRVNPICTNPRIIIRNTGKHTLKSVTVRYGLENGIKTEYNWQGHLEYLQAEEVYLPTPNWNGLADNQNFIVSLLNPNTKADEYPRNSTLKSVVKLPLVLPKEFIIHIESNDEGRAIENSYFLADDNGKVLYQREQFTDSTTFNDPIKLENGCYEFRLIDDMQDGMNRHWWNRGSETDKVGINGLIEIRSIEGEILHKFHYDFGQELQLNFRVGKLK